MRELPFPDEFGVSAAQMPLGAMTGAGRRSMNLLLDLGN